MKNLEIFSESDFIRMDFQGKFNLEETLSSLNRLIKGVGNVELYDILFDLTRTKCQLTELDIYHIAEFMSENASLFKGRVAILLDCDLAIDKSRFLKFCISEPEIRVRIFFDNQAAKNWFDSPPTLV
ncbi:hypothetical protein [Pleionea sediminis]|uniref:hypothetical protein n=1 Tax=Pleionea sediminis TaxID=2569479 RepID=UPI001184705D|nr:hypothetical protein [Pleionea sediminis]